MEKHKTFELPVNITILLRNMFNDLNYICVKYFVDRRLKNRVKHFQFEVKYKLILVHELIKLEHVVLRVFSACCPTSAPCSYQGCPTSVGLLSCVYSVQAVLPGLRAGCPTCAQCRLFCMWSVQAALPTSVKCRLSCIAQCRLSCMCSVLAVLHVVSVGCTAYQCQVQAVLVQCRLHCLPVLSAGCTAWTQHAGCSACAQCGLSCMCLVKAVLHVLSEGCSVCA